VLAFNVVDGYIRVGCMETFRMQNECPSEGLWIGCGCRFGVQRDSYDRHWIQ